MTRLIAGLSMLLLIGEARALDLACTIVKLSRVVEVQRQEGVWMRASAGTKLSPGDKVSTGYKATATLQFPDSSVLEIQPMSLVLVKQLEDVDGKVTSRVWLRMGEVKAEVGRVKFRESDFQIKTATCTASVRGTKIHRVFYTPAAGTIVEMGEEGHLVIGATRGRAGLGTRDATHVRHTLDVPMTPGDLELEASLTDLAPTGTTSEEEVDMQGAGVPKTAPLTQGGSGLAGVAALSGSAAHVTVEIPQLP